MNTKPQQLSIKLEMKYRILEKWFYFKRWWKDGGYRYPCSAPFLWVLFMSFSGGFQ